MNRLLPHLLALYVGAGLGVVVAGAVFAVRESPCAVPECVGYAVEVERR